MRSKQKSGSTLTKGFTIVRAGKREKMELHLHRFVSSAAFVAESADLIDSGIGVRYRPMFFLSCWYNLLDEISLRS